MNPGHLLGRAAMSVIANMAMSLDGFVADHDDGVDDLFGFYFDGEVPVSTGGEQPAFSMSPTSAAVFRGSLAGIGSFLVGRRLYDLTHGWEGRPPVPTAPLVVLTHQAPDDPPTNGVPVHFVADIDEAVDLAVELAGGKDVSVGGGAAGRSVLDAGRLDAIEVALVPVVLGSGVPWLAGIRRPVRLGDPTVVSAPGVVHLRYDVLR